MEKDLWICYNEIMWAWNIFPKLIDINNITNKYIYNIFH